MYAIVDLEATNALNGYDRRIIQIGITFIEDRQIQETLCFDINPDIPINPKITELTGITDEQVAQAPLFEEIAEYIYTLLEGCIFVAHNVQFDYSLLKKEFDLAGYTDFNLQTLDTIELSKIVFPTELSYSLKSLSESKHILIHTHHNAGSDSLATAELFLLILECIDNLDDSVSQTIHYILHEKSDVHATLFKQGTHIHTITYTVPNRPINNIKLQSDVTYSEIYVSIQQKKHPLVQDMPIEQLFSELLSLHRPILCLVPNERKMVDIQQNIPYAYCLEKELCYINIPQFIKCLNQLKTFTIQESRQLCSVLVWLGISQTGLLSELDLPDKIMYRLSINGSEDEQSTYLQHIKHMKKHHVVVMYQQEFIRHIDLLKNTLDMEHLQLCIFDIYAWTKQLEYAQTYSLYHYKHVYALLNHKQRLQQLVSEETSMPLIEHITKVDHIIDEYKWFLHGFMRKYSHLFGDEEKEGTYSYFIDETCQINSFWFVRFKHAIEQFKECIEEGCGLSYELYEELCQQEKHIQELIVKKEQEQFLVLEKQNKKFATYRIFAQKIIDAQWMQAFIYSNVLHILYVGHISEEQENILPYLQKFLHDPLLELIKMHSSNVEQFRVNLHPIVASKENLFIKKLNAYIKTIQEICVVIVPSRRMLRKLMEINEHVTNHIQQNAKQHIVLVTWKEWQSKQLELSAVKRVVITKLPFDSPDSLEAIVGKNYLLSDDETYFDNIAFPKMMFMLSECLQTCIHNHLHVEILDNRVLESVYAHKIQENLANICLFKELNIETMFN
ncbi:MULTISPECIES: PolC-type DNA polymerase III [unclassified Granulicatella]|uniref:3'-5' exonuclease n=1 Tax=unclassified Granulicatella TaxID=2630493 RepID=UPI0010736049|nr:MULTISPECIES: exonuclease domain-containing protein [unclassified Granulicatella]MBF0780660.1 hypothetical protein [Granulicatella sp. 19428wC4_WM01]TFU94560.1 hypothetical protein E4T68_06080 [Granulicatella sp. WM01]